MINEQILSYIRQQLSNNVSRDVITNNLKSQGWLEADINEAFVALSNSTLTTPPQNVVSQQNNLALLAAPALLGQAWSLYKQRFGTFVGVMIMPIVLLIGLLTLVAGGSFALFILLSKFSAGGIIFPIIFVLLIVLVIFLSQIWGQTALLYAVKGSQERIGIKESYRKGWHKIGSYFWIIILAAFITIGGLLLLVIPGIIFIFWFSLAFFVLIAEDLKGMDALLKSKEYVRGRWGSVAWRIFFIGIISFFISLMLTLIFSFLKIPLGEIIVRIINGLFLTPLVMTYLFLMYNNIKTVKGDFVFAPTKGQKAKFLLIGLLGFLIIPALVGLSGLLRFRANINYPINTINITPQSITPAPIY